MKSQMVPPGSSQGLILNTLIMLSKKIRRLSHKIMFKNGLVNICQKLATPHDNDGQCCLSLNSKGQCTCSHQWNFQCYKPEYHDLPSQNKQTITKIKRDQLLELTNNDKQAKVSSIWNWWIHRNHDQGYLYAFISQALQFYSIHQGQGMLVCSTFLVKKKKVI